MRLIKVLDVLQKGDISLCDNCNGTGRMSDCSFGSGATDYLTCGTCNGLGRTVIITATCDVQVPFDYIKP